MAFEKKIARAILALLAEEDLVAGGPLRVGDRDVYGFLSKYFLHQDQLSWGRVNILIVLEGGALAFAYASSNWLFGALVLVLMAWVIHRLHLVLKRDWQIQWHLYSEVLLPVHRARGLEVRPQSGAATPSGQRTLNQIFRIVVLGNLALATIMVLYDLLHTGLPVAHPS